MSSLGDALKEIVTNIKKDPETEAQLQGFRKEIAESYVQKLEKRKIRFISFYRKRSGSRLFSR